MADYLNFANIKTAIHETIKDSGQKKAAILPYLINEVYLNQIMSLEDWTRPFFWLLQLDTTRWSVDPTAISGITAANPGVITTSAAHGLVAGDVIGCDDIVGMTELNGQMITIASVPTTTTITTDIDTSGYTAYSFGGYTYQRGVTLSNACTGIFSAGWNGYAPPMQPINAKDMEESTTHHWEDATGGPPTHYLHKQDYSTAGVQTDKLIWSPASDGAYNLRVWYRRTTPRLSADADVPLLPPHLHDTIVSGVVARLTEPPKDGRVSAENASLWPTLYQANIAAIKTFNHKWWESIANRKQVMHHML